VTRIDVLPDDILLEIFYFYMNEYSITLETKRDVEAWQSLVHVCRRWRSLVFESPRRLSLRLCCSASTPAKDRLDAWPALPLVINGFIAMALSSGTDNVIAALGQSNRVCRVILFGVADWQLEKFLAVMQVPFPELTVLQLSAYDETAPIIPDSFLGGSATRLQCFELDGIPFPGLPNLLSSATHLVYLDLTDIPHSGYISPGSMADLLSVLSCLRAFTLGFQSPQSRPDQESQSLLPPKHTLLPALDRLHFKGVTEYLEQLVTRVDAPQLFNMNITFFNQIDFDFPRLAQFINRTPTLRALNEARVQFNDRIANIALQSRPSKTNFVDLQINILCVEPDWQLSSIEQFCSSSLHPLSTVEELYFESHSSALVWENDATESTLWLGVLLPFTAVRNLYLSKKFAPAIGAPALQELIGARITEVLPSLRNIFVEDVDPSGYRSFEKNVGQFVAARQLSDHPVAISLYGDAISLSGTFLGDW